MAEAGGISARRVAFLLLSKTGGGKSSLANALLRTTEFQVGRGMLTSTAYCKCISTHARGRDLTVVDTPGTMDVSDKVRAEAEIQRAIGFCPAGFDIFLVVIKCDSRFTDEEKLAVDVVAKMFGEQFYTHAIVVFSHGDDYDNDEGEFKRDLERIRREIPYLEELLGKCGNRFVLVDNSRRCDRAVQDKQIESLLALTDSLVRSNWDRKFTSEHFVSAQRKQREAEKNMAEEAAKEERKRKEEMRQEAREIERADLESLLDARRRSEEEQWERRAAERKEELLLTVTKGFLQALPIIVSALASSEISVTFEPDYGLRRRGIEFHATDSSDEGDSD